MSVRDLMHKEWELSVQRAEKFYTRLAEQLSAAWQLLETKRRFDARMSRLERRQ